MIGVDGMSDAAAGNAAKDGALTPFCAHGYTRPIPCWKAHCRSARSSNRRLPTGAAIAVTDTNNLFGALEFAEGIEDGLQPIIGCQVDIAFGDHNDNGRSVNPRVAAGPRSVVLLAATEEGYANIRAARQSRVSGNTGR